MKTAVSLVLSLLLFLPTLQAQVNEQDSLELVRFYNATDGDNWTNNSSWLVVPVAEWFGIQLSDDGRRVIEIKLNDNNLTGELVDLNLPHLQHLELDGNELSGEIPDFSQFDSLQHLHIENNQLSFAGLEQNIDAGFEINYSPQACISISRAVRKLSVSAGGTLSNNYYRWYRDGFFKGSFTGNNTLHISEAGTYSCEIRNSVATELTLCTDDLVVEEESLYAPVNEADSLELVRFYHITNGDNWNDYTKTGWLVERLADWNGIILDDSGTRVTEIRAGSNMAIDLTDLIDLNLPKLQSLDLSYNGLSGTIPDFRHLPDLQKLDLSKNELSGQIPDFKNLPNLQELDLAKNPLSGSIPNFSNLPNLISLQLEYYYSSPSESQLSGQIPDFKNLPNLQELNLRSNQLSGEIPDFSNLPNLQELDLAANQLSGTIPNFNLPSLVKLFLSGNQLSGEIPNFFNLTKLTDLYLSYNQLTGLSDFSNLNELVNVSLRDNQLSGEIPDFSHATPLHWFDLRNNQLSGAVPDFSNLEHLYIVKVHENNLTFEGVEKNVIDAKFGPCTEYSPCFDYAPQACIPISQIDNTLSVSAGGTLSNNTYTWFKDGEQLTQITGANTLSISKTGTYSCEITNSIATQLTLCTDDWVVDEILSEVQVNEADYLELIRLYNATDGENWTNKDAWLTAPVKEWHGVQLSEDGKRITKIELNNNNLKGDLVDLNLPYLEILNLAENELNKHIPNFKYLPKLKELHLDNNRFYGGVPNFNNLMELQEFQANNNNLSGAVPDFTNLQNLQKLDLHNNQLTSSIPDFTNLPNLIVLNLNSNKLSGRIPDFSKLPKLETLDLTANQINGEIPNFNHLPNLSYLSLENNQNLSSEIPDFNKLSNLQHLSLAGNQHNGTIPNFSKSPNLAYINLSNNQLTFAGLEENITANFEISYSPQACISISQNNNTLSVLAGGTLSNNTYTWFRDGQLIGINQGENTLNVSKIGTYSCKITNSIALELVLCTDDLTIEQESLYTTVNESDSLELVRFYQAVNEENDWNYGGWLVERLAEWSGITLSEDGTRVVEIDLRFALINTENVELIDFNLPKLKSLTMQNCKLVGEIPAFSNLKELEELDLSRNKLNGEIPNFNFPNLTKLNLTDNQLNGEIPDFNLPNLPKLELSDNQLNGEVPDFSHLTALVELDLSRNKLNGLPPKFSNLPNLRRLYMSNNQLSGEISDIGDLTKLTDVYLNNNQLVGKIPDFNHATNLEWLDLGENQLSGSIPDFTNLPKLFVLKFDRNNLTFEGLEKNASILNLSGCYDDAPCFGYYPQACITISQNDNTLSVSAGGTLSNNTYTWFKDGEQIAEIVGDSTLNISETGTYSCEITNNIADELTLCTDDFVAEELSASTQINETDSLELLRFYHAINGDDWTDNTGWLVAPVTEWFGIRLNEDDTRVTKILLGANNLVGELIDLNLPKLEILTLNNNNISGAIPDFDNLSNLEILDLDNNDISGTIPDFDNLSKLKELKADYNQLSGQIPEFSNSPDLEIIDLDRNQLSDVIPDFNNLTKLRELKLNNNLLSGAIPDFEHLSNLEILNLSRNELSSTIPNFNNLTNVKEIYLNNNTLSDTIPNFTNLPNLEKINLNNNQLKGEVPEFNNLTQLKELQADDNQLTGTIPDFSSLPNLQHLELDDNQLSGTIPDFSNLPNLQHLELDNNQLIGTIPDFNSLPNLQYLKLDHNQLSGTIPDFSNSFNLKNIYLNYNELSGIIPNFSQFESLELLFIHKNQLNFAGLEQNIDAGFEINYIDQACIPISQNDNTLFVSAGGTLSNNTYTWFNDGDQIAEIVGDSTLNISETGTYSCEIANSIATELTLCTDDFIAMTTSVINHTSPITIQLSPNPIFTNQTLNITYPNQQPILIQLYDISGKVILEQQSNGQNQHYIQMPDLSVGTYFVKIVEEKTGKQVMQKLFVMD